jgi:hypothetical protein
MDVRGVRPRAEVAGTWVFVARSRRHR